MTEQRISPLDVPGALRKVSMSLKNDIDTFCIEHYDEGSERTHLGGSVIGHPCRRYSWYQFRWVKKIKFSGRMYRLFNRGHREEERLLQYLIGIGCQVWALDENGKQFRVSAVNGHMGGSFDGVAVLPEKYGISEPLLVEFKTSNASRFNELRKKGMPVSKPRHFAQTSWYGYKKGYRYVLYVMVNKDDDDIELQILKLDAELGASMEAKGESIINSPVAPPRLSENPRLSECKNCDYETVCHQGAASWKNCRSCAYAQPVENKQWFCHLPQHNAVIPIEVIPKGCGAWKPIAGH